jgi:ribosomal protein L40E
MNIQYSSMRIVISFRRKGSLAEETMSASMFMRVSKFSLVVLLFVTILMMSPLPSPVRAIYSAGQIQWCKGITSTAQNFGTFSFGGGCISPVGSATFSTTDGAAFILLQMADIGTVTYEFFTQWRDPNGDLCAECTHDSGGITFNVNAITISDSIQISGRLPASRPGTWSVELLVSPGNVSPVSLATSSFTIGSTQTAPTTFGVTVGVDPSITQVTVDGQASAAGTKFTWNQGDQHTLSAKKTVAGDKPGTQYVFTGWSDGVSDTTRTITVNSNAVYTAQYKTQYQLTVNSDYGSATGADWYDEGSKTNAVLDTSTVSDGPLYNWVFAGWTDDASGTNLKSNPITMDSPKTTTATWNHDFSMIFYAIIGAVIAVVAVAGIMLMRRGKAPKTPRMAAPATQLSGEQKFCPHCHAVLPMEAAVCSACGKPT